MGNVDMCLRVYTHTHTQTHMPLLGCNRFNVVVTGDSDAVFWSRKDMMDADARGYTGFRV